MPMSRFKIFGVYQMLTISQFLGWGKGNVAQNKDNFTGGTKGKLCYLKRGLEKLFLFFAQTGKCQRSEAHLKSQGLYFSNTNGKAQNKYKSTKLSHRKRNSKVKRSNKPFFLVCLMLRNRPADKPNPLRGKQPTCSEELPLLSIMLEISVKLLGGLKCHDHHFPQFKLIDFNSSQTYCRF